jgi:hypothetical protein
VRNDRWDQDTLLSAMGAIAASKGHPQVAEAIVNLDTDLIARLIALDFDT